MLENPLSLSQAHDLLRRSPEGRKTLTRSNGLRMVTPRPLKKYRTMKQSSCLPNSVKFSSNMCWKDLEEQRTRILGEEEAIVNKVLGEEEAIVNKVLGEEEAIVNKVLGEEETIVKKSIGRRGSHCEQGIGRRGNHCEEEYWEKRKPL
ncbi:hypothetical protein RRG08_050151 [Elysia crispata]|uniref:Uncharacterized protein n=1 Tax=Elysia crispata TaxID=231223 RepID=A0AAE1ADL1_9GAST|nr:hypothetical protein RRG08_050151 [Elysia crispata]